MEIVTGLTGVAELVVSAQDTAAAWRSGEVLVLATPRLLALCEEACVRALTGRLDAGRTTVGTRVELDHRSPVFPDSTVTARAVLDAVDGARLRFTVEAHAGPDLVASGVVERAIVTTARFSR